ncbi:metallophosphoesterase family protein [Paenisporosarcina sp. TG20]|uniref:metallophosphoesterase family protein n=1 Tax=Paenisporosarcina sp. TG20 TaxID=1211706 RepID=UPI00031ADDD5|nr:metallophosphoesterase [Paenisporosarcina sp. TG20]
MRILVISDTHGETDLMDHVKQEVGPLDAVFHCGDSELDAHHASLQSCYVVAGNCDWDSSFETEVFTEVNGVPIFMTHGHLLQVKSSLIPLTTRAQELGAAVILYGHTHLLGAELIDDALFVNPGSLELPRGRKEKSYAIIEKSHLKWQVTFFSNEHKIIDQVIFPIVKN